MTRMDDILNLELMFGQGCCDCLDKGRPRLSLHPLDTLKNSQDYNKGKSIGYIEMDLETEEVTSHSYEK